MHVRTLLPEDRYTHTSHSGNANHHLVLGTLGKGIPTGSWSIYPGLLLLPVVLGASPQHRPEHAARTQAGLRLLLGYRHRELGAHQGYQRLQEERSGTACPQ